MKTLKKRRRIQVIAIAVLALGLMTALVSYSFRDGINFYRSPSEVVAMPPPPSEKFRIGGLVGEGSLQRAGETVSFVVTDGAADVTVRFTGVLPDLFAENQGMIGEGHLKDGTFIAARILAKHDETYMPKEVVDTLKEQGVYRAPNAPEGGI